MMDRTNTDTSKYVRPIEYDSIFNLISLTLIKFSGRPVVRPYVCPFSRNSYNNYDKI